MHGGKMAAKRKINQTLAQIGLRAIANSAQPLNFLTAAIRVAVRYNVWTRVIVKITKVFGQHFVTRIANLPHRRRSIFCSMEQCVSGAKKNQLVERTTYGPVKFNGVTKWTDLSISFARLCRRFSVPIRPLTFSIRMRPSAGVRRSRANALISGRSRLCLHVSAIFLAVRINCPQKFIDLWKCSHFLWRTGAIWKKVCKFMHPTCVAHK